MRETQLGSDAYSKSVRRCDTTAERALATSFAPYRMAALGFCCGTNLTLTTRCYEGMISEKLQFSVLIPIFQFEIYYLVPFTG